MRKLNYILLFMLPLAIMAQENQIDLNGYFYGKYRSDRVKNFAWGNESGQY